MKEQVVFRQLGPEIDQLSQGNGLGSSALAFGPIFTRELVLTPRRPRFYILRAAYCLGLLLLVATAWLVLTGTQVVDTVGGLARFGASMFHLLAPLQLVVTTFFAALMAASAVAQEKDRQTLDLLLMTRLTNWELVLGKLFASLITVSVLIVAALPIFAFLCLFGGVGFDQVLRTTLVSLASMFVAGSIGATVAFWREKTFQALAGTTLALVMWVGLGEAFAAGLFGEGFWILSWKELGKAISPWQAVIAAAKPVPLGGQSGDTLLLGLPGSLLGFLGTSFILASVLNGIAVANVRRWAKAHEPPPVLPEPERSPALSEEFSAGLANPAAPSIPSKVGPSQVEETTGQGGTFLAEVSTSAGVKRDSLLPLPREAFLEEIASAPRRFPGENADAIGAIPTPQGKPSPGIESHAESQIGWAAAWRWNREQFKRAEGFSPERETATQDSRPWWMDLFFPPGKKTVRQVWSNPILWREMCTQGYGRRMLVIRMGYLLVFAAVAWLIHALLEAGALSASGLGGLAIAALFLVSLVLVNTQAVSSLISERDGRTLDLLLVTDITPKEFVYGKIFGTFFNTKEMVILPLALCFYLWWKGAIAGLELFYLVVGLGVLYAFVAMLGVHVGMIYESSRNAVAVSLGTIFFLFVGVATCIWMMIAFSGRFEAQLPFLGLIVFGGAALYLALGVRNPSTAIGIASFACPLMTFYAITSFFLEQPHLVFVTMVAGYGFATAAMLIPAIDEFDVATGRTTVEE